MNKHPSCWEENLTSAQPLTSAHPTHNPAPHNNNINSKKYEVDKKSWLLFLYRPTCFSLYDPFADVMLWDIYEAIPERSLNDLTDNEIEID